MRKESAPRRPSLAAATANPVPSDTAVVVPAGQFIPRIALSPARTALRRAPAHLALIALLACCAAIVIFASNGPTVLVWHSENAFPDWMAGPLRSLFGTLPHDVPTLSRWFGLVSLAMLIAYGVVLLEARWLSMRTIWVFVFAVSAVMLIGPPFGPNDVFNYLGYARLGALHGLNPYTHVIHAETFDPVSPFVSWHNWHSPYGPLFTALTYPLGLMRLSVAYWVLKVVTVLANLLFVWLVAKCARLTGRDPRWAVLFVAANPLFLVEELGGFHNDVFMMAASMAAIAFVLSRRDRSAGAAVAVAVAIKFTAILILPFLLVAAGSRSRRVRMLSGVVLAGIPLLILSVALFGTSLPNVTGQSDLLTAYSIPNLLGWAVGLGGATPLLLKILELCLLAVVVHQLLRNRNWLAGAGWASAALIACMGGLWPWYIIWLLPLAAIASSTRLRVTTLTLTVFLMLTSAPYVTNLLWTHGVHPLSSPVGQRAVADLAVDTGIPVTTRISPATLRQIEASAIRRASATQSHRESDRPSR